MKKQEELKQFLAQRAFDKWADDNQIFISDLRDLLEEMVMFEAKHGIKVHPNFEHYKKPEGRRLGV